MLRSVVNVAVATTVVRFCCDWMVLSQQVPLHCMYLMPRDDRATRGSWPETYVAADGRKPISMPMKKISLVIEERNVPLAAESEEPPSLSLFSRQE